MYNTRLSSKLEILPADPNSGPEACRGSSVPEVGVFIRKKRMKKTVESVAKEVKTVPHGQKLSGPPDIEDFAYAKASGSPQLASLFSK
ncbi:unnamed protein product [Ilex paraguariensis]|uniref:Uncharacterized protein n=1 Tax=Ilex paraguariensis TaxID=185542 RepID=A0ABC8SL24_9AQUA